MRMSHTVKGTPSTLRHKVRLEKVPEDEDVSWWYCVYK